MKKANRDSTLQEKPEANSLEGFKEGDIHSGSKREFLSRSEVSGQEREEGFEKKLPALAMKTEFLVSDVSD